MGLYKIFPYLPFNKNIDTMSVLILNTLRTILDHTKRDWKREVNIYNIHVSGWLSKQMIYFMNVYRVGLA